MTQKVLWLLPLLVTILRPCSAISAEIWNKMINDMGRQRMFSQRMAKAFLMITKGVQVEAAKTDLQKIAASYDKVIRALLDGTDGYVPPPSAQVEVGLQTAVAAWLPYQALLLDNMDNVTVNSTDVLADLSWMNLDVLKKSNFVVGAYVDAAAASGTATAGLQVDIAGRQRMLTQRMTKEALLIGLDIDREANLQNLENTMQLFSDSHSGLLRGSTFVGLPKLTSMCALWQMRIVSDLWNNFKPVVEDILDVRGASEEVLEALAETNLPLLVEMNKAVGIMANGDTSCSPKEGIDYAGWASLINGGGKQRMMGQKASRLFFQVAKGVKIADSRVTLSTTMSTGSDSLRQLIEGSVALNIPAPPTQEIASKLVGLWDSWEKLSAMLTSNTNSGSVSKKVIHRVAVLSREALHSMNEAVEMYVQVALDVKPDVPSVTINIAGRQRMFQAKMSKEALLVVLGEEAEENIANMETTIDDFERVHWQLLLGIPASGSDLGIPRTTDVCILNQMMHVLGRFNELKMLCWDAAAAGSKVAIEQLEDIDELNPVAFATMNAAVSMYAVGKGTCTLEPTAEEWDMVLAELGRMRASVERVARDFLYTVQEVNSTNGDINLPSSLAALEQSLSLLKYGAISEAVPTPPSQALTDELFALGDAFEALRTKLQVSDLGEVDVDEVITSSAALASRAAALAEVYVDAAWTMKPSVEGARLNASGTLLLIVERVQKQVMLLRFSDCAVCVAEGARLAESIQLFDNTYDLLMNGRVATQRRLQNSDDDAAGVTGSKTDVQPTLSGSIALLQMQEVARTWETLRPVVQNIDERYKSMQKVPGLDQVVEVADIGHKLAGTAANAVDRYATVSRTTTPVPIHLLTPLPLTGHWPAGKTMRTAARFAEDIINQQQEVLKGFAIKNTFYDDRCDPEEGVQLLLQETVKANYVALAGMGCNAVCGSAAFAAASMNMPFLSYECPGVELSNLEQFPHFVRMGAPLSQDATIVKALAELYGWVQITIVSGSPALFATEVERMQASLKSVGLASDNYYSYDRSWEETRDMMNGIVASKRRVLMVMGEEPYFRRLVCASLVVGANKGITWIYSGIHSKSWWVVDDRELLLLEPTCTGVAISESFQGALNIAGLGRPTPQDEDKPLDCFRGYTSKTFLEDLDKHLLDGYPVPGDNTTAVPRPYMELRAHAADGVCALAKTMQYLMAEPRSVSLEDLQKPGAALYKDFVQHLKTDLTFQGVSGRVNFTGNIKPEPLALRQVKDGDFVMVGIVFPNQTMRLGENGGPTNESWQPALPNEKPYFPYFVFQIMVPLLVICCPSIAGWIRRM
eukprot:TRINITY_DN9570_c0_g2_i2.p1 TRINITY_DN9570_c0_g2~~TRINITY_DN9570_c0_g2_i2.p1  ORF type:complete len:1321 (+),score=343.38 TRINITY_DN9570_c0_g2_i2:87-4049(+)